MVTFKDGGTAIGTGNLNNGVAIFMTSTLTTGTHSITAVYNGDGTFAASTSSVLTQNVTNSSSDSTKPATPIVANAWAQSVTAAMGDATSASFSGNPQSLSPAGTGFTYYFNDDPQAQRSAELAAGTERSAAGKFRADAAGDATVGTGGEFGGIGLSTHFWTWTARGSIPF